MNRRTCGAMVLVALVGFTAAALAQTAGAPAQKPAGGPQAGESWFKASIVAGKIWRIDDHGSDNMYLVEGTQRALLVDTGTGAAKLGDFVRTLTKLPVIVLNTHGHPDHSGGNNLFSQVYAHPGDFEAIRAMNTPEARRKSAEGTAKSAAAADLLSPEEAGRLTPATLVALKNGQIFDLGGRTLEVFEQPGHTPGEIVLLDKANRLVIAGDSNNTLVWLFLPNSRPLEVYLASLKKLKQRAGEFDTILPGHGGPLPAGHLDDQIACVEEILSGQCTGEPYQSFAGSARVCKHGGAAVAFDPKNLRVAK